MSACSFALCWWSAKTCPLLEQELWDTDSELLLHHLMLISLTFAAVGAGPLDTSQGRGPTRVTPVGWHQANLSSHLLVSQTLLSAT